MASTPQNEAVTSEQTIEDEVGEAVESSVAAQAATMMGIKHPGVLQSVEVDLVVTLQYNNPRLENQKANLSAVALEEGTYNLYSPFKRDKKEEAIQGVMRIALPQIIQAINEINTAKLMILGESRASISKNITNLVENLQHTARIAVTGLMADDVALVSTDENKITIKDFVRVGQWNTPQAVGPITQNSACIGLTIQIPELYDVELKLIAVNRIFKFLLNLLNKSGAEVAILLAVAVNPAMLDDELVRDFTGQLHDENWVYYTRYDLYRNVDKEAWVPRNKKDIDAFLLPGDGATYSTEMLFVKAVQEDDAEDDAVESAD